MRPRILSVVAVIGLALALLPNTLLAQGNKLPGVPTGNSPANGATNVAANPTLTWSASGATSYEVRFGTVNPPPFVATRSNASYPTTTATGTTYVWQIVARNKRGATTGPVWSFTTAAPPPTCQDPNATNYGGPAPCTYPPPAEICGNGLDDNGDGQIDEGCAPPPPSGESAAFGIWTPSSRDTCTKDQHDAYSVIGPDGKRYPTWHPPTGPNGCTFGHEHGRNPAGSNLLSDLQAQYGGVLFGYGNESLDVWNSVNGISNGMRHEDHVGHKIEWENDLTIYESTTTGGANRRALAVKCDFFMKIHQGTHSKDAFTNNMHELLYAIQCHDGPGGAIGSKAIVTKMVTFGEPGGFSEGSVSGGFTFIPVGPATPSNSPTGSNGLRAVPTINRVLESILVPAGQWSQYSLGLYEDWISSNYIRKSGQVQELLYFDPHFAVFSPSRFYWPGTDPNLYGITRTDEDRTNNMGRSVDVCWMQQVVNGQVEKFRGGECDFMTNYGSVPRFAYDDPRSAFNGVHREFYFNNTGIVNPGGVVWYFTDPFGNAASAAAGPGLIPQYISAVDNRKRTEDGYISATGRAYPLESIAIGGTRDYGGAGVHAPN